MKDRLAKKCRIRRFAEEQKQDRRNWCHRTQDCVGAVRDAAGVAANKWEQSRVGISSQGSNQGPRTEGVVEVEKKQKR